MSINFFTIMLSFILMYMTVCSISIVMIEEESVVDHFLQLRMKNMLRTCFVLSLIVYVLYTIVR